MRILFFTDPHLNVKLFNHLTPQGINARLPEFVDTFKWLSELCNLKNVDRVVCGGDIFNSVADLLPPYFNFSFWALDQLNRPLDILDGNHDKYDQIYKPLDPMKKLGRVWSEPASFYEHNLELRVVMIPFIREEELLVNTYETLLDMSDDPTLVFIHQGLAGRIPDNLAIPKELFTSRPYIKHVFAGHYHFAFDEGNIHYPGSLFALNFGDSQVEKRYVMIYDSKTNEVEKIENEHAARFISMTQPQFNKMFDEFEDVADKFYIRIFKGKDEELTIPLEKLSKFRGYVVAKERDKGKKERMYQVDYSQVEQDLNESARFELTGSDKMSCDLTREEFKVLINEATEDTTMKEQAKEYLDEVLQQSFSVGVSK
jgi:DNA repair exonuclease SbcCD nuclease subunit